MLLALVALTCSLDDSSCLNIMSLLFLLSPNILAPHKDPSVNISDCDQIEGSVLYSTSSHKHGYQADNEFILPGLYVH